MRVAFSMRSPEINLRVAALRIIPGDLAAAHSPPPVLCTRNGQRTRVNSRPMGVSTRRRHVRHTDDDAAVASRTRRASTGSQEQNNARSSLSGPAGLPAPAGQETRAKATVVNNFHMIMTASRRTKAATCDSTEYSAGTCLFWRLAREAHPCIAQRACVRACMRTYVWVRGCRTSKRARRCHSRDT